MLASGFGPFFRGNRTYIRRSPKVVPFFKGITWNFNLNRLIIDYYDNLPNVSLFYH